MATLQGTKNNDLLVGSPSENDRILGLKGDDELFGDGGDDTIFSHQGEDVINAGPGDDILFGQSGDDTVIHNVSENNQGASDFYHGGSGFDTLMLLVTRAQKDALENTSIVSDFNVASGKFFDFSVFEAELQNELNDPNFTFDLQIIGFENLILNQLAIATDDEYFTNENTQLIVGSEMGLFANDDDEFKDDFQLVFADTSSTLGADVLVNLDGSFTYNPLVSPAIQNLSAGEMTVDTFTYQIQLIDPITGALGPVSTATVSINLLGENDAPMVDPDKTINLDEDTGPIDLNIGAPTDPDTNDILTITVTLVPLEGVVEKSGGEDLSLGDPLSISELQGLRFVPNEHFSGNPGEFIYEVDDANGGTVLQIISFDITPVVDTPILQVNSISVDADYRQISLNLSAFLIDVDGSESLRVEATQVPMGIMVKH